MTTYSRVADHQRLTFVAAQHAGREIPDRLQSSSVRDRDLSEAAVPGGGEVLPRHGPVAVFDFCGSGCLLARRSGGNGTRAWQRHRDDDNQPKQEKRSRWSDAPADVVHRGGRIIEIR